MLAKFPVVLGQGILLFNRHVLAEVSIKSGEKVDLTANQRIEIALRMVEWRQVSESLQCFYLKSRVGVMGQLSQ